MTKKKDSESDDARKAEIERLRLEQRRDQGHRVRKIGVSLDARKQDVPAGAKPTSPPRRTANKTDAPSDFDPELGRLVPKFEAEAESNDVENLRFVRMATDVVARIGQSSQYREWLPVASPPPPTPMEIDAALWAAREELEALHRKLFPGWREIVLSWLNTHAEVKIEAKYREAFDGRLGAYEREHRIGRTNIVPARIPTSGAKLLAALRRNPPELMGEIPEGLTPKMLDYAAACAVRSQGGASGTTPKVLLESLEEAESRLIILVRGTRVVVEVNASCTVWAVHRDERDSASVSSLRQALRCNRWERL